MSKSVKNVGHKNHIRAVAFWNKVDWSLSNSQIVDLYGRCYANVAIARKVYAPRSAPARKEFGAWRGKVLKLMVGKKAHIYTKNFIEQQCVRQAGYGLGIKLKMSTVANGFHMKIG